MGLIDRYVFSSFMRVFMICFAGLFSMYVVGDFVNNLNELLDYGRESGGLARAMVRYYGPALPWFFDVTAAVASLIATVFTVTWLQRYNELTALMAAGITRWRVVRTLVIASALISFLGAVNREACIPRYRSDLSHNIQDRVGKRVHRLRPRYDRVTQVIFDGEKVIKSEHAIVQPCLQLPATLAGWGSQLRADRAVKIPANADHPTGYLLENVRIPQEVDQRNNVALEGDVVLYGPRETRWLEPGQSFLVSNVPLAQLTSEASHQKYASTQQLIRDLRNPSMEFGRDVSLAIHVRFVQPILDLVLSLAGLGIILGKVSRNVFIASGYAMLLVAGHFGVTLGSHALGLGFVIDAALAAWVPLFVMVPVTAVLVDTIWH